MATPITWPIATSRCDSISLCEPTGKNLFPEWMGISFLLDVPHSFQLLLVNIQCRNSVAKISNHVNIGLPLSNLLHFIFGVLLDYISHYMFKAYILKALQNLSLPLELFKPAFMAIHCHLHRPLMSEQSITFKFNCVHTFSRLPKVQFKHMFRMNPVLVVKRLFALCDETAHRQESSWLSKCLLETRKASCQVHG